MEIPGWFDFEEVYLGQIHAADTKKQSIFVEIGALFGKSTYFMADQILRSGKQIEFFVVDTWEGSPLEPMYHEAVKAHGGSLFGAFASNVQAVATAIKPLRMDSLLAAQWFTDQSVDFTFHDGCHQPDYLREELLRWVPKIRRGGTMAGHDWSWPGLAGAVESVIPSCELQVIGNSWLWVNSNNSRVQLDVST